ncbi:Hypothetical protein PENO1_054340 [Penicillium occitanis (nom. inval.)]|nr:hypothetical protein PENOC_062850 [Penicillium occitanis (nom. inval.)]PCG99153.1 Hypothetical protein PENO1_054340 [Penicillium occitanis (nom. inval.)]
MSDNNENNSTHAPEASQDHPSESEERVKEYRRILAKLIQDLKSRITEEDLRKIISEPIGKRDSTTDTVIDLDIYWEYLPREQDGLTIDPFMASKILWQVADKALRQKLRNIPGYSWTESLRQSDGTYRYVVCYMGQEFQLPNYLQNLPFVTTQEHQWRPSEFNLAGAPPDFARK